jgi:hypothetical protein
MKLDFSELDVDLLEERKTRQSKQIKDALNTKEVRDFIINGYSVQNSTIEQIVTVLNDKIASQFKKEDITSPNPKYDKKKKVSTSNQKTITVNKQPDFNRNQIINVLSEAKLYVPRKRKKSTVGN